jgi:heterotetrameric sarcosine oxidase gamma subunit
MLTQKETEPVPETTAPEARRTASAPVARSPLSLVGETVIVDGWEYAAFAAAGPIVVADRSTLSKVQVRAAATAEVIEAMGTRFGRAVWREDRLVVGSGPDEWLVLGAPGAAAEIAEHFRSTAGAADPRQVDVMDLTHGRALVRVSGPETMSLMRRVTAVDLDDRLVPNGSALRSSLAKVVTDIVRDDQAGSPSFLLHCERSSGRYLQESLLAAGRDLGAVADSTHPAWPDHS